MTRIVVFVLSFGLMACGLAPVRIAEPDHLKLYNKKGNFEDVKQDIEIAITGRGLVVDHEAHIGAMLDRTGKDLGTTKPIYGSVIPSEQHILKRQALLTSPAYTLCP